MKPSQGVVYGAVGGIALGCLVTYFVSGRNNDADQTVKTVVADVKATMTTAVQSLCDPKIAAAPFSERQALIAAKVVADSNAEQSTIIENFRAQIKDSTTLLQPKIAELGNQLKEFKNDLDEALACSDQTGPCKDAKLRVGAILEKQQGLIQELHTYLLGSPQSPSPFAELAKSTQACTTSNLQLAKQNLDLTKKLDDTAKVFHDVLLLAQRRGDAPLVPDSITFSSLSHGPDYEMVQLEGRKADMTSECRTIQLGVTFQSPLASNILVFPERFDDVEARPGICTAKIRVNAQLQANWNTRLMFFLRPTDGIRRNTR